MTFCVLNKSLVILSPSRIQSAYNQPLTISINKDIFCGIWHCILRFSQGDLYSRVGIVKSDFKIPIPYWPGSDKNSIGFFAKEFVAFPNIIHSITLLLLLVGGNQEIIDGQMDF